MVPHQRAQSSDHFNAWRTVRRIAAAHTQNSQKDQRMSPLSRPRLFRILAVTGLCLAVAGLQANAAKRKPKRPITKPKFIPSAEKVELFAGMKKGQLAVKVIPRNAKGGKILVENKTSKPLTVQLPKAIVGVQVLKQVAPPGGAGGAGGGLGGGLGGGGYGGGNGGYGGGMMGGSQPFGGGMGMMGGMGMGGMGMGGMGMGGMGMGGMGMGGGFFSVPPERVVSVPYHSVCLAHGKPEPSPKATYRLMKVEDYTKDKTLQELITLVGTRRINQKVAQAAAWHLTDKMSWRQLAMKRVEQLGGLPPVPYFARGHIYGAQSLVARATAEARKSDDNKKTRPANLRGFRGRLTRVRRAGR